MVVAAGFAAAAGFFFAAAGLGAADGLADSSSLPFVASGLTTVAPPVAGFLVMVAELTEEAVDFGIVVVLAVVVIAALERGSPRALSRTAFSAYSLIYTTDSNSSSLIGR